MKIFVTRNLSKHTPEQHAVFDFYGRIAQDEFKRLANFILEGIPCYINEQRIETDIHGMPKYGYEIVECSPTELPDRILTLLQTNAKKIGFSQALYNYNQNVKEQVEDYIERRSRFIQSLEIRNQAYKDIQNAAVKQGITAYSPCNRTYWEVKAERNFFGSLPTDDNITDEQIEFVKLNARKFGLEIPTLKFYIASRDAIRYDKDGNIISNHGRTEEIFRVIHSRENSNQRPGQPPRDWKTAFHPNNMPEDFMVQDAGTTRAMYKEVYKQLMWFMSLPVDEQNNFIADGYTRCPHCGQIVRIALDDDGIEARCELCETVLDNLDGIEYSKGSNDHLFYSTDVSDSYSDLADVKGYIEDTDEETEAAFIYSGDAK